MRDLRVGALFAVLIVSSCGGEVTAPPDSESAPVESTKSTVVTAATTPSSEPAVPSTEPSTTVSDSVETQTTARESPTTTTTIARPLSGPVVLRGDGLGNARFGSPMSEVEPWLLGVLGDPWREAVVRAPLAASQRFEARNMLRTLTFEIGDVSDQTGPATSLVVVFSDLSDARDDGVVHLAGWEISQSGDETLATPAGLTIGTSSAELQELFSSVEFGLTDPHGGLDSWFAITSADTGEAGIRGLLSREDRVLRLESGADTRQPDEIPDPPQTPDGPTVPDLVLRPDGLGPTDFNADAGDLVTTLTERFGLPAEEMNVHAPPGDTLRYRPRYGYFGETELRHLTWYDPGLVIVVADGPVAGGTSPGDLRLLNWATSSNRLRLASGLGVGSAFVELVGAYSDVTVGAIDECAGAYYPRSVTVTTDTGTLDESTGWFWVHGSIAWDWVSDVQRALNERGASLAVDGQYGPRTTAAVAAFQTQAAVNSTRSWDSAGEIGPQTLDALGLAAPGTAPIEHLRAGYSEGC